MQIDIKIGNESAVIRGNEDGTVDLCHWVDYTKNGETVPTLVPFKFYTSLYSCLQRASEMKLNRRTISDLGELMTAIEEERVWLKGMLKI